MSTPSVASLRQTYEHEHQLWQTQPYRQARVRDAYTAWFRISVKAGNPPDSLARRIEDETERFLDRVIAGVDGHSYWDGAREGFVRNNGTRRNARLWWWEHIHGLIEKRAVVKPVCGEPHCITPEHQEISLWGEHRQHFSDQQCHGALQVAAMRIGRSPTRTEYDELRLVPTSGAMCRRFASWNRALAAAGLPPSGVIGGAGEQQWSRDDCIAALRRVKTELGYVPNSKVWRAMRLSPSEHTIRRRCGTWLVALTEAGVR